MGAATHLVEGEVLVVVVAGDGGQVGQPLSRHVQPLALLAHARVEQRPAAGCECHLLRARGRRVQDGGGARVQPAVERRVRGARVRVQRALQRLEQAAAVAQVHEELAVLLHLEAATNNNNNRLESVGSGAEAGKFFN